MTTAPSDAVSTTGWRDDPTTRADTIARLESVLELLAVHGFVEAACRQAHCSKQTFYDFRARYADFADEAQHAIDRARVELEATGWACARKALNDPRYQQSLIFALRAKAGWRDTSHIDITGSGKAQDPREMTDEELLACIEESRELLSGEPS